MVQVNSTGVMDPAIAANGNSDKCTAQALCSREMDNSNMANGTQEDKLEKNLRKKKRIKLTDSRNKKMPPKLLII